MEVDKMDPEVKESWVTALRSGEYEQGHGSLKSEDRYCCLGVLCEIHPGASWNGPIACYDRSVSSALLPPALRHDLNIACGAEDQLAIMNDEGSSFDNIATWIEEHL